ncbi:MAG: hypothetical protein WC269_04865 [Candidatus Gracilibacteria bacterium]|jgi:hypothetical protein
MKNICKICSLEFEVTKGDLEFLKKLSPEIGGKKYLISEPKICPQCRLARRLSLRAERRLYKRKCDLCKKEMITIFNEKLKKKVYCTDCWWSDKFDPTIHGRKYDFTRPFFDQYADLMKTVPLPAILVGNSENSDYTNLAWANKNCYLTFASDYNQDCYYCYYSYTSTNCFDCTNIKDSELLYECIDVEKCKNSTYLKNCNNCFDCHHCFDCVSCRDCFGCVGLRNKQYCLFNKQLGREEYLKADKSGVGEFEELKLKYPHKYAIISNCENCSGDNLFSCKNCENCYQVIESEDCKNVVLGFKSKDCLDCFGVTSSQLCYESAGSPENYNLLFSSVIWGVSSYLFYSSYCRSSSNSFGCISLLKNNYCILNKQYTKEEYEDMLPRVIEHMKSTGEWGENFSPKTCPVPYNDSAAMDYYPLEKSAALALGYEWYDEDVKSRLPQSKEIFVCKECGKNYKISDLEYKFYQKFGINIPVKCPECRLVARTRKRNPFKLWDRSCAKCGVEIKTTYSPDRPETIYCEPCYLKTVY